MARMLRLTNEQFDVLYDVLEDTISNISDNIEDTDLELNDYEIYKVWQQMNSNKSEPKVTNSDKVYPEVDDVPEQIRNDWLTSKDDNYGDKVDTLVGNMVASDDNVFTHDSEGC